MTFLIRHSGVSLLVALILLFISAPFVQDLPRGDLIEAALLTVVMVFAVLAVGGRRKSLIITLVLLIPTLVSRWMAYLHPDLLYPIVFLAFSIIFFSFVVGYLLRFIVRSPQVNSNVLCAGISGFLLLGLLWTPVYVLVGRLDAHAFNMPVIAGTQSTMDGFNAFFFSFVTLCTVGYGDITPMSKVARMLAVTEAIAGIFYIAVMVSRLVSLYSGNKPSNTPGGEDT